MASTTEPPVWLATRVASLMEAFERARRLEAAADGAVLPTDPPDLMPGLLCGFARALRRLADCEPQVVPRAIRHLADLRPEYSHASDHLMQQLGNEMVAVWSDLGEAIVEAAERSEDPSAVMLDFAALIRRYNLYADDAGGVGPAGAGVRGDADAAAVRGAGFTRRL
jgi:hypothetical protein